MTLPFPGARFRRALRDESPLQVVGTINANRALLARRDGTQRGVLDTMQTRDELYERIGDHDDEDRLDRTFAQRKSPSA